MYGAESGAGNARGKAAFDGGERIILRLTEKFGVVRVVEMTRRKSERTQLDERGVSVAFVGRDGILHHPEKKADGNEHRGERHRQRSGLSLWQPFSHFCRETSLLIVSEKSLMTGFP